MDFSYQVKVNQLNRWESMRQNGRQELTPEETGAAFDAFNQEIRSFLDKDGTCLIPKKNQETVNICGSNKVQQSHTISEPVLKRIASPGNPPSRLEVHEQTALAKNHIAQATKFGPNGSFGDKRSWQIGRIKPQTHSISTASCRGFSCNQCDAETFLKIENQRINFPETKRIIPIHDEGSILNNPLLEDQLFILSYRAITAATSELRGSIKMMEIAASPRKDPSEPRRQIQIERALALRRLSSTRIEPTKHRMDYRVAQIHPMPMIHYLVPVNPAVPAAGCHVTVTPEGLTYTKIIYPEDKSHNQTWLIISCLEKDFFKVRQYMDSEANQSLQTNQNQAFAANLLTEIASEYHFGYFQPEGYQLFREEYPNHAEYIEESQARALIDEWHDFVFGAE